MATTDKPIALQTNMQKTEQAFNAFLTPEEEVTIEAEDIIESSLFSELV